MSGEWAVNRQAQVHRSQKTEGVARSRGDGGWRNVALGWGFVVLVANDGPGSKVIGNGRAAQR